MKAIKLAAIALATSMATMYVLADDVMQISFRSGDKAEIPVTEIAGMSFATPAAPVEGHEYVDLGLPSGLKWATCNIGADRSSDLGDYFAWGETETRFQYDNSDAMWHRVSFETLKAQGVIDDAGNLTADYDAATTLWGDAWRMPTSAEIRELIDNCSWEWTTVEGRFGYTVTGPNGNSIFLPAAGWRIYGYFEYVIYDGYYWSATAIDDSSNKSDAIHFSSEKRDTNKYYRFYGFSIRPVTEGTDVLSRPANVKVTLDADNNVKVSWNAVPGAERYRVYISSDGNNYKMSIGTTDTEVTIQSPYVGFNTYTVEAIAADGTVSKMSAPTETIYRSAYDVSGHGYVDLGLPSKLKWATYNIGAESVTAFGDYFAWGETTTKTSYNENNTQWYSYDAATLIQKGVIDEDKNLMPEYDAATANWGVDWRMPTRADFEELLRECSWRWATFQGQTGVIVTGPNGNSIFLPASGYKYEERLINTDTEGNYWSATYAGIQTPTLYIDDSHRQIDDYVISCGFTVRPVTERVGTLPTPQNVKATPTANGEILISWDPVEGAKGYYVYNSTDGYNYHWMASILVGNEITSRGASGDWYWYRVYAEGDNSARSLGSIPVGPVSTKTGIEPPTFEYVDLGLPSHTAWAKYALGATWEACPPYNFGWGEMEMKLEFYKYNSLYYGTPYSTLLSEGVIGVDGVLKPDHDFLSITYGAQWSIPTVEQFQELIDLCTWEWTRVSGQDGYVVTGPNGNSIFLCPWGYMKDKKLIQDYRNPTAYFWTANYGTDNMPQAFVVSRDKKEVVGMPAYYGMEIRPVINLSK